MKKENLKAVLTAAKVKIQQLIALTASLEEEIRIKDEYIQELKKS